MKPNARSAAISNRGANHEKALTLGATRLPVNGSLNALQCDRMCAAANPTALANPTITAAAGARGGDAKTRAPARSRLRPAG